MSSDAMPASLASHLRRPVARRAFLAALGGAVLARPTVSRARSHMKTPRIGWLTSSIAHERNLGTFRKEMRGLGYEAVDIDIRAADGQMDRLPALAAALVSKTVDVIVIDGGPALIAARNATTAIPIVIGAAALDLVQMRVRDPVKATPRSDQIAPARRAHHRASVSQKSHCAVRIPAPSMIE